MTTKLPAGWQVENLGLIEAVQFTHVYGRVMLWCDDEWRVGSTHGMRPAPGIPAAHSMAEARKVGTAFINEVEASA
jgi:hypothetical protein